MEENTVRVNEIEEYTIDPETNIQEAPESSNGGAFAAGVVGGIAAYVMIVVTNKALAFAKKHVHMPVFGNRKQKDGVVDAEWTEAPAEQEDSDETPESK